MYKSPQDPIKKAKSATFAECTPRRTPLAPPEFHPWCVPLSYIPTAATVWSGWMVEIEVRSGRCSVAMKGCSNYCYLLHFFLVFPFKGASSGRLFCPGSTPPFAQEKRTRCKSACVLPFASLLLLPLILLPLPLLDIFLYCFLVGHLPHHLISFGFGSLPFGISFFLSFARRKLPRLGSTWSPNPQSLPG